MKTGVELITAERRRQIQKEGWTAKHDDMHKGGDMAAAAAVYALVSAGYHAHNHRLLDQYWPMGWDFNPKDKISNLVRAGALIAAEIDRLARLEQLKDAK